MHAQSDCGPGRPCPTTATPPRGTGFSMRKSTHLTRTHAQTLNAHGHLRACTKHSLLRMQARNCELASEVGRVVCTPEVFHKRPLCGCVYGQGGEICARSMCLRPTPALRHDGTRLNAHQSTCPARTNAQTLSAHGQLRACEKRSLQRKLARICELACVAGCVLCALEVVHARSMFERSYDQDRSNAARPK